ncbi:MAG: DUF5060 domain-containing protein [Chthonomonadales bacterium]|nr:DUF5060 domain-containing protein [Chthonomonadales bacterium]
MSGRVLRAAHAAVMAALVGIGGCGGPDFGGAPRASGFDSGLGGSYSGLGGGYGGAGFGSPGFAPAGGRPGQARPDEGVRGTYAMVEVSFELPDVKGNPFDFTQNDVMVTVQQPDRRMLRIPAFFDGGKMWRARFTPTQAGRHSVSAVTLNGAAAAVQEVGKREFEVTGEREHGFVRVDPRDRARFAFDDGSAYYPIGHNAAWGDVADMLARMGPAGLNWSRVWMAHFGGLNLDWVMNEKIPEGTLSLDVARKWDAIVAAAEKAGIHFQMVLQHHGQYSSRVNSNWAENPWNKSNGGFLAGPAEFFTSSRAIALTKAKYRYIVARWGYSPAVMAWELFNEVEWTDAIAEKRPRDVVAWHDGMAAFLRDQDPYRHLVTTSSTLEVAGLWRNMDYYQPHAYPSDPIPVVTSIDGRKWDKPGFYGEIGPGEGLSSDDGSFLRRALWASMMSTSAGAAEYWAWDTVFRNGLLPIFTPAASFLRQSGALSHRQLEPLAASVDSEQRAPLTFGPGGGWSSATQADYVVSPSGTVEGQSTMPAFLQGKAHAEMFSAAVLKVVYPVDGTFAVSIGQVARAGARVRLLVDGTQAAAKEYSPAESDHAVRDTLEAKVSAGAHTVRVENDGADWVVLRGFTLTPYAPSLGVLAKGSKAYAVAWLYRRLGPGAEAKATLHLPGLDAGGYRVTWWGCDEGKTLSQVDARVPSGGVLTVPVPVSEGDLALWAARAGGPPQAK